jgi:hypothetical protein
VSEAVNIERRLHTRHRARTRVHIRCDGKPSRMCAAVNLSASGVAVKTDGMSLGLGAVVELSFAIELGTVVKIHRRFGRVCHISAGITGFAMEPYGAKVVEFKP